MKECFVEFCTNNSANSSKIFVPVPTVSEKRKLWFEAAGRDLYRNARTLFYCCEDHFDIENDMENYMQFKILKGNIKIKMKRDVIPHKFGWMPEYVNCKTELLDVKLEPVEIKAEPEENAQEVSMFTQPSKVTKTTRTVGIQCYFFAFNSADKETQTDEVVDDNFECCMAKQRPKRKNIRKPQKSRKRRRKRRIEEDASSTDSCVEDVVSNVVPEEITIKCSPCSSPVDNWETPGIFVQTSEVKTEIKPEPDDW